MIEDKNISEVLMSIWRILAHFRPSGQMTEMQLQQTAVAFTFLRRIDCLIGQYAKESATFFSKNAGVLSDERLSEKLCEISGGYPFYNFSGYNIKEILRSNNSIEVAMDSYLQGFSKNVQGILFGMGFDDNLAVLSRQSRFLVELLDCCEKLDFSSMTVDNEEFVHILTSMLGNASTENGVFFTGTNLSRLICECLMADDVRKNKEDNLTIYDPTCGTGSLLTLAGEKAKKYTVHQENVSLFGQEIALFPCAIADALALLSGGSNSRIAYGDTLAEDAFPDNYFQYILADSPFGVSWRPIQAKIQMEALDASGRFSMGLPVVSDSQFLFIEHIISKMSPEGSRAAFITTPAVLWAGDARSGESRIRRWMFEHDLVETIIALPAGSHTTASIPIYLWILSNKKYKGQVGKVHLIDASSMKSKNRRSGLDSDMVKFIFDEYQSKIISTKSQIVNNEQFGYYEVDLLENGKRKERVTISLDADIHEFVEKERQPYAKGEITIDYSSVEKGYSVQFEKFFAQEKADVSSLTDATCGLMHVMDSIETIKKDLVRIKGRSEAKSWDELPLGVITEIILGGSKPSVYDPSGLPILSVSYIRKPSNEEPLYEVTPRSKCSSKNDVIVIVKGDNAGEVFKGVEGILSSSVAAIKCIDENVIIPQFFYYLLKGYEKSLRYLAKGVAQKSLDSKSILNLKCIIPPIEEQKRLVSYLDDAVGKIDKVIEALGNDDNVFSAYRQTLIENVVRGRVIIS